jgi:DNA-directed RNA polymerases I, II, and III subunit RPABC2
MSDNEEEYNSGSETGSEISTKIKTKFNKKPTISDYNDDDVDDDDAIVGDDDDENDENNDDKNINVNEDDSGDDENDIINTVEDDDDIYDDEEIYEEEDDSSDDEENDDQDDDNNNIIGGAKSTKGRVKQIKKQSNIPIEIENNESIYDDDDDEQDDNYLQKFDKEITKNYIMNFHPECLNHNYDEIKALSNVTRDEFNIIIDPLHKTVPFLTKYEKARILGQRAKQIECGAKPLVKVPENIIDSYLIAELELEQKAIPFIIRRPIPSGGSEYWNLKDLEIISF